MILQLWKNIVTGVAWGGFITFIALTILVITDTETTVFTIWLYMSGSLFLGIYFGCAAFIFFIVGWSPLKKTAIHFIVSLSVYFTLALPMGWVPLNWIAISSSTIIFIIIYILFWIGYNLYYRNMTDSLNESLEEQSKLK